MTTDGELQIPLRISRSADKPTTCPAWCRGHGEDYADDFGEFTGNEIEAFQEARADFRTHCRYIADVTLWTLTPGIWIEGSAPPWAERPDTERYSVALESPDKPGVSLTPVKLALSPSPTRSG